VEISSGRRLVPEAGSPACFYIMKKNFAALEVSTPSREKKKRGVNTVILTKKQNNHATRSHGEILHEKKKK